MDRDLDYIVAVAECKSISKAAEMLYISQPSLSRFIKRLEDKYEVNFFSRTPEGVELTEAGTIYVDYAREMRRLQKKLDKGLKECKKKQDSIRIVMSLNAMTLIVQEVVEVFHERYPQCKVEIQNVMSREIPDMILDKKFDFATGPLVGDKSMFSYQQLCEVEYLLAVPKRYDLSAVSYYKEGYKAPWVNLEDIQNLEFVFQNENTNIGKNIRSILRQRGIHIEPRFTVTSSMLAIQAAENQTSCCFLADSLSEAPGKSSNVTLYHVGLENASASVVISNKGKIFSKEERYLISLLKAEMLRIREDIHNKL